MPVNVDQDQTQPDAPDDENVYWSNEKTARSMKPAIRVGGPTTDGRDQFEAMLEMTLEAEKLGVDAAWSAEERAPRWRCTKSCEERFPEPPARPPRAVQGYACRVIEALVDHITIKGGGRFLQEIKGPEVARAMIAFMQRYPSG